MPLTKKSENSAARFFEIILNFYGIQMIMTSSTQVIKNKFTAQCPQAPF